MGNIAHSRGSVVPFWKELKAQGKELPVTDYNMTRYWVDGPELCRVVKLALKGKDVLYTPRTVAFLLRDLVTAFEHRSYKVGLRPGERIHEKLSATESSHRPERFLTVAELRELIK